MASLYEATHFSYNTLFRFVVSLVLLFSMHKLFIVSDVCAALISQKPIHFAFLHDNRRETRRNGRKIVHFDGKNGQ